MMLRFFIFAEYNNKVNVFAVVYWSKRYIL